jgi:hypothetical protein
VIGGFIFLSFHASEFPAAYTRPWCQLEILKRCFEQIFGEFVWRKIEIPIVLDDFVSTGNFVSQLYHFVSNGSIEVALKTFKTLSSAIRFSIQILFVFFSSIFLAILSASRAQNVDLNCLFFTEFNQYTCLISNIEVADNENQVFVVGGNHTDGRSNNDVQRLKIMFANIPFVISTLFSVFPNVQSLTIDSAQLSRIQPGAFDNAAQLTTVTIIRNSIRRLPARLFPAASRLRTIDVDTNLIVEVDENAFEGLSNLQQLYLDQNSITSLPPNVFRPLPLLRNLFLQHNQLTSLDGSLFANNPLLFQLDIDRNQVNTIGRSFLNGLNNLLSFSLVGNVCVNRFWSIQGSTTLESVKADLEPCFVNSE